MRITLRSIGIAVVGLMMVCLADRAHGVSPGLCCKCVCGDQVTCVGVFTDSDCPAACPGGGTTCTSFIFPNSCASLADQCTQELQAPALGPTGLTATALILAGLGTLGVWRAARRRRA